MEVINEDEIDSSEVQYHKAISFCKGIIKELESQVNGESEEYNLITREVLSVIPDYIENSKFIGYFEEENIKRAYFQIPRSDHSIKVEEDSTSLDVKGFTSEYPEVDFICIESTPIGKEYSGLDQLPAIYITKHSPDPTNNQQYLRMLNIIYLYNATGYDNYIKIDSINTVLSISTYSEVNGQQIPTKILSRFDIKGMKDSLKDVFLMDLGKDLKNPEQDDSRVGRV